MKTVYIDEYGAFGFQFDKPNCSSHFIICAIVVEEQDVAELEFVWRFLRKVTRSWSYESDPLWSSKVTRLS